MVPVSPSDLIINYFTVFELKPSFTLDLADLERRFYRLAKMLHPDRFANHPDPTEKTRSIEKMSLVNQAYQTLKSAELRRDHVLECYQVPKVKPALPADLAEEWFDVQDEPGSLAFQTFADKLSKRESDLNRSLKNLENEFDQSGNTETLKKISALVQDVAYLQSLSRDLESKKNG